MAEQPKQQQLPKRITRVDVADYSVMVPKSVNANGLSMQLHARQGWTMELGRAGIVATHKEGLTLGIPYANVRFWIEE